MSDEFVTNEPIATGNLRTELRGNVHAAMGYVREARRMLGALRTHYGVNERIAAGEPGGFYRQGRQLDDGSLLEVFTNDGNDTIRITSPQQALPVVSPVASQASDSSIAGNVASSGAVTDYTPMPEEVPPLPKKPEEEEEEENPVDEYHPYLWIGARIVDGPRDDDGKFIEKLHVCVWEMPDREGQEPVILSNRNELIKGQDAERGEERYPLQPWKQFTPEGDMENGIAYTDAKLFMLLPRNGLSMKVPDARDDEPDYDVVFISDPDNDLRIDTPKGPMEGNDQGGTYYVKIMVEGPDCGPDRFGTVNVELRIITGKQGYVDDSNKKFDITQFTEYKMGILPKGWFDPLPNNGPDIDPLGCSTCDDPITDHGPNPHAEHWWQGMATVDLAPDQVNVKPSELELSLTTYDEYGLPPTGFEPGSFPSHIDRCPACVSSKTLYYTYAIEAASATGWYFDRVQIGYDTVLNIPQWAWYVHFWHQIPAVDYVLFTHDLLQNAGISSIDVTGERSGYTTTLAIVYDTLAPDGSPSMGVHAGLYKDYFEVQSFLGYQFGVSGLDTTTPMMDFLATATGAEIFAMLEFLMGPPFQNEWMWAYYKATWTYDKEGVEHGPSVQIIGKYEFDHAPHDLGGPGLAKVQCSKVAKDE